MLTKRSSWSAMDSIGGRIYGLQAVGRSGGKVVKDNGWCGGDETVVSALTTTREGLLGNMKNSFRYLLIYAWSAVQNER